MTLCCTLLACVCVCVTIYPHGRSPLSQLLKPVHGHLIVHGTSHLRPGAFHMLYKHTTNTAYITESGRENKQARIWVTPKRKKEEVLAFFCASMTTASVYPSEIPSQTPGTLTYVFALTDPASVSTGPNSPLSSRLFLTIAFP